MKDYLLGKKKDIKQLEIKPRDISFIETKTVAQAVIGPRRAGKSFSLFYWIKKQNIADEDYVLINFEDDEIISLKREEKIKFLKYHMELYGKEPEYIFLDEIQNLERWDSFLYSLIEKKKYKIFITGSSSKLLSKEISTSLRGRTIDQVVFPLSFKEVLNLKNIEVKEPLHSMDIARINNELMNYILSTGFPMVIIDQIDPRLFFKEYYELIIFKDIVERYNIENIYALKMILSRLISSCSCRVSINKIYNDLRSMGLKIGKRTIYSYIYLLETVFSIFLLKKLSFSIRKSEVSIPKIYLCDNGFVNYLLTTRTDKDIGRLMENLVYIELYKRSFKNGQDLFYYQSPQGYEIDFVIKEGLGIKELIQVTYASEFDEIDPREYRALIKASELFKGTRLTIITWDYEDQRVLEWWGRKAKIDFVPLWKWLLKT